MCRKHALLVTLNVTEYIDVRLYVMTARRGVTESSGERLPSENAIQIQAALLVFETTAEQRAKLLL